MNSASRVVVITGAAAGVGRATARMFAETEGARLALIARDGESLQAACDEVTALGGTAIAIVADVADANAIEDAAERIERELGPIDVWVNVAMTTVFSFIKDMTAADFKRVTEVCYLGYVHGTLAALKRMQPRDHGHIIQVGSALAYRGIPLQAAYCASKHAIQGFMDSLTTELLHDKSNVIACMVQMPALNTPQFDWCKSNMPRKARPVAPVFEPEVAARAIVFASKSRRREIYVGISTFIAIIGNKLAPRFADWYLGRTGVDGQMAPQPDSPDRPDNLAAPVIGNRGARGRFSNEASAHSPLLWTDTHRGLVLGSMLLATVLGTALLVTRQGRR